MYKDKDKQREANRQAQAKFKAKGITEALAEGITEGITLQKKMGITEGITEGVLPDAELKAHFAKPKRGKDIKCFADLPPDVQETIDKMSLVEGKIDKTIKANRTAIAINYQHLFPGRYHGTGPWALSKAELVTGKPGDTDYNGVCTEAWRAERGR